MINVCAGSPSCHGGQNSCNELPVSASQLMRWPMEFVSATAALNILMDKYERPLMWLCLKT